MHTQSSPNALICHPASHICISPVAIVKPTPLWTGPQKLSAKKVFQGTGFLPLLKSCWIYFVRKPSFWALDSSDLALHTRNIIKSGSTTSIILIAKSTTVSFQPRETVTPRHPTAADISNPNQLQPQLPKVETSELLY